MYNAATMVQRTHHKNLVELFEFNVSKHPSNPLFGTREGEGEYKWMTYQQVDERVNCCRAGLAGLGIRKGDAVGVISKNGPDWAVAAFATYGLGARFIPMYEKELPAIWKHIIIDGNIKVLFVSTRDVYDPVQAMRKEFPGLEHLFIIKDSTDLSMGRLESEGAKTPIPSQKPDSREIAVLIYTSGTTGHPKGVLLSHGNFTHNVYAGSKIFPQLGPQSRSLSILPWAHSYGQTGELYNLIAMGASIGFARSVTTIADDMKVLKPTFLIAVPRVFNTIHHGIVTKINEAGGLAKFLFNMGLDGARQRREAATAGHSAPLAALKFKVADGIVFKKIRQGLGGQMQGAMTGSALMNAEVGQFFADLGIPLYDCYGLSETTPGVTMNGPEAHRPGSVGRALEDVRVVIDASIGGQSEGEGEIIVYGPNVMQGYHNLPEATQAVMTPDGGFRTGDCGRLDKDGFLFITGRIKEQYKLENGKYVFPASLEDEIRRVPWVQNALIFGEGKAFNVCIVVPNFTLLSEWARHHGLPDDPSQMVTHPKICEVVAEAITSHLTGKFGGYEIPKRFILASEDFSVENGMLTQTLKLKRRTVLQRYSEQIAEAYK